MTTNQQLMERRQAAVARGVGTIHGVFADQAKNSEVWDVEGKRYIDFASGIAVLNTGHLHPTVVARVQEQMTRFSHTCFHVMPYEPYIEVAERLNALVPGESPKKTLLVNTGAEAVENAIKISRAATGRSAVIAFGGGFHGRTLAAVSLTGKVEPYKTGFGPFMPEVFHAPFPCPLHGISIDDAIHGVEKLFKFDVEPSRVAAIIIEPVQGEGGFYIAPPEFMKKLRALCDKHGILLIADEVQSGFGRTGKMFATEYAGIEPDLMTLAKSLAGGFPLAAVGGKAEVMDAAAPGGLGGTYGGNPLACAAALGVLEAIEAENLLERSRVIGQRMTDRLQAMAERFDCVGEVRGLGAMVAMELFEDRDRSRPAADLTKALVAKAAEKGLILLSCGLYANVIRILVPLTVEDTILDEGLNIIEQSLETLTAPAAVA